MVYNQVKTIIKQTCSSIYKKAYQLLFPSCCANCKQLLNNETIFCNECYCKIKPIVSKPVQLNNKYTMSVLAIADYQDPIKPLILAKQWSDVIASKQLGELIWQLTNFKNMPVDYLIPVPLHWTRYAWRGYNQTEEIAKVLGKYRDIPVINLVKRKKKTRFQTTLSAGERTKNVADAFVLSAKDLDRYKNKHLVIVDDLMTTGSTLIATAKALIAANPASITAIVPCRVTGN